MSTQPKRSLIGLLVTQFFGAFNDNAWKFLVLLLGMNTWIAANPGAEAEAKEAADLAWTTWSFLALNLALFLFTIPSAYIADRFSKRSVIISMKFFELMLMSVGLIFLWQDPENSLVIFFIVLAGLGAQSALFSPAKYGIVPQLVSHRSLSHANGLLEFFTIMAIVGGGLVMGSLLPGLGIDDGKWGDNTAWMAGGLLVFFALVGLVSSFSIPRVAPAGKSSGTLGGIFRLAWRDVRSKRPLWLAILGLAFYWGIASFLGPVAIVKGSLLVEDVTVPLLKNKSLLLGVFACGVGLGSLLTGKLSAGKVEYGFVPLGAFGMAFFTLLLGLLDTGLTGSLLFMFMIGVSSGLVLVPLMAILQWLSSEEHRGSVIALSNLFTFGGMIIGNLLGVFLVSVMGIGMNGLFIGAGLITVAGTIWALRLVPDAFIRLLLILFSNTFYKLRIIGAENVPSKGGALLVPNHVSFVDGLFLVASIDRPVRFIVESSYFHHPIYGPFLRAFNAIEVSSSGGPRVILKAMRDAGEYIDEGHLVCIFGEGQITRTGQMQPFKRGLERIVKGRDAPIIPVNLDGVWGSIFSRSGGRFLTKIPKKIPYPVTISYGEPMEPGTSVTEVRKAVQDLGSDAWNTHRGGVKPLHHNFISSSRPLLRIFSWLGLVVGFFAGLFNYDWTLGMSLAWFALSPFIGLGAGALLAHLLGRPFRLAFADMNTSRVGRLKGLI
ncbi:MAG: MFS transporter, partial [Planctomycetota bacterium]|nr:MFS transporter [Planctomycetota bacterium]